MRVMALKRKESISQIHVIQIQLKLRMMSTKSLASTRLRKCCASNPARKTKSGACFIQRIHSKTTGIYSSHLF